MSDLAWIVVIESLWLATIYLNRFFAARERLRLEELLERTTLPCGCTPDPNGFDCKHDVRGTS